MAIDTNRIMELMDLYDNKIRSWRPGGFVIKPHVDPGVQSRENLEHSRYMCRTIGNFCDDLQKIQIKPSSASYWSDLQKYHSLREKIMRWLGWLQRTLCFFGLYTLEDCKRHLMPIGEEFRADGGTPGLKLNPDREVFGVKPDKVRASHIRTILQGLEPDQIVAVLSEVGYCARCGSSAGARCQCTNDD